MTLSEAIRLEGLTGSPQAFDGWMGTPARCSLAGAADSAGLMPLFDNRQERWGIPYAALDACFPILLATGHACPECGNQKSWARGRVKDVIVHLNDFHMATRNRIADWVASIEPKEQCSLPTPAQESDAVACPAIP